MTEILALIEEHQKTLNMLIDMAKQDKQKQLKYQTASRTNAATKTYNLVNAITGGRIVNDSSGGISPAKQAPKYHSGSTLTRQQQQDNIQQDNAQLMLGV